MSIHPLHYPDVVQFDNDNGDDDDDDYGDDDGDDRSSNDGEASIRDDLDFSAFHRPCNNLERLREARP